MTKPKQYLAGSWLGAAALGLMLAACDSGSSDVKDSGQGLTESSSAGTVSLVDSSVVEQSRSAPVQADGSFALDMSGLEAPFLLKLEWTDGAEVRRFYAVSESRENLDVNALTNLAFRGSHDDDMDRDESDDDAEDDRDYHDSDHDGKRAKADRARGVLAQLTVALAPLFERYGIVDPRTDRDAVRRLLADVKVSLEGRTVTITNRATGGVIFVGRLSRLSQGVFTAANMPPGPGTGTCTAFTYSAFAACQPDGTQSRTVLTSTPAGCTGGAPVTTQACTYVPPVDACTAFTYGAYGACQPDSTQTRAVLTSSPAGCTGGAPVTTQACTYVPPVNACTAFTYGAYGACQPDSTQTRAILTSTPAGCTGGAPVTMQACVYTPPLDGAALYTQYCSSCHGNGKKGSSANSTKLAIDNDVGGMGSAALRALTPAQLAAIAAAP